MWHQNPDVRKVNKKTLVDRLEKLVAIGRTINAPVEIFFDEVAWAKVQKEFEVIYGIYAHRAPNEVYDKLEECNRKPHSYFGIRDGLINKVRDCQKDELTIRDLQNLFEEGDALTLGEFRPLGNFNDFFSTMNDRFYGSFGQRAFTFEGQVPSKSSNDPLIQQVNARNLYQRIINGDFGYDGKVVVQKWGSGGLLDSVAEFLAKIQELDKNNKTQIYQRIEYVVSDVSEKSINDIKQNVAKTKKIQAHVDRGVLRFDILDAKKPLFSNVANIESSYLYDSISQPIIAKVDGNFYELYFRGYIDARRENEFEMVDYSKANPIEFKHWFETRNFEKLSLVKPRAFGHINWEVKLVKIDDISKYPNGKDLEDMVVSVDNLTLPTAKTSIESMELAMNTLCSKGYVQVFDLGIIDSKTIPSNSGDIHRYNGAVYSLVNFPIIRQVLQSRGFNVKVEHLTEYFERILGERVIPSLTLSYCAKDTKTFDKYFPFEFMKNSKWIQKKANKIKREKGYSCAGSEEFYGALKKMGVFGGCIDGFCNRSLPNEDYVADFRENIRLAIYRLDFKEGTNWIFEKSPNDDVLKILQSLGFKKILIDNLFKYHKEIVSNLEYQHLCLQRNL